MGFFDKIKKAFMGDTETKPTEKELAEETQASPEEVETPNEINESNEENQASKEDSERSNEIDEMPEEKQFSSLEVLADLPEKESVADETPVDPLDVVDPVIQAENLVELKEVTELEAEVVVQEKYEKGLEKTRKTFSERLNELFANFRSVDEDFFEELEETLIGADVGFDTAIKITEALRQEVKLKNAKKPAAIQNTIIEKMVDLYEAEGVDENNALNIQPNGLTVMLFVGVNGVGKTTSIGKLAHEFKQDGKKVLLAAADTFRAGAIDQLVVWGERAGVEVVRGKAGGDPAAVVFDAVDRAKAENADILLVDTAGRLQNKVNLMKELEKIKRVIQREIPDAPHEVLLVVDATTGQNAMSQAKQFKETTDVTGLVLSKLDGTAKGGIVLAIRNELHLPVKLVGLGEGIDDLEPFDANDFAVGLFKGLLKMED